MILSATSTNNNELEIIILPFDLLMMKTRHNIADFKPNFNRLKNNDTVLIKLCDNF